MAVGGLLQPPLLLLSCSSINFIERSPYEWLFISKLFVVRNKLRRSAASLQLGASATPATTAVSHGAAHKVEVQEAQTYDKPVAFVAIAGYLLAFLCMLPTTKTGFAADCVPWRDLLAKPCGFAMFAVIIVVLALKCNIIQTVDTSVPHQSGATVGVTGSTPAVSTTQHATITAPAAPVGAADGTVLLTASTAFKPPSSTAGPSITPLTTVHEEASESDDLPTLSTKEEAVTYLNEVKRFLDEMTAEAKDLTEQAYRDLADIENAGDTPAAQIIALHKFCGSLLDSFSDIPQRLTALADALKKFVTVFEKICQHIENVREEIHSTIASYKASTNAVTLEIRSLEDRIDKWMEPTHRILLGEAAYALALLAEQHVFGSQGSGYEHHLTINQLHSMYRARQLEPKQARTEFSSKDMPCVPDCTFASKIHRSLLQKFFS